MQATRINGRSIDDYKDFDVLENGLAVPSAEPLYAPAIVNGYWPDDIIVDDSLILFYPFDLLKGSKIKTVDRFKVTGTVTNDVWRPNGRLCAGNGGIDLGNPANLDITTSFSLFALVKPNTGASLQLISKDASVGGDRGWFFDIQATSKTRFLTSIDGTKLSIQSANAANATNATWASFGCSCEVGIRADAALKLFTNGIIEASTWSGGGGSLGSDIQAVNNAASKVWVGRHGTAASYFDGTYGVVIAYKRVLSAAEFLHNHKVLEWRMQ